MNQRTKSLSEQVRELDPVERIALVEDVLDSLDRPSTEMERIWVREAGDRLDAYRRGELEARDLAEIASKYRSRK